MDSLQNLRERIDALDERLLALFTERAEIAQVVASVKAAEQSTPVYYRPEREAEILSRLKALNPGPLSDDTVGRLFRELMSACLALQVPTSVAYLGPAGTFTEAAVLQYFGTAIETIPVTTIGEVFRSTEAGATDFGVVPVENSTEGVVAHTLDCLVETRLTICGEVELRIHHQLLGNVTTLQTINTVYAHQQAFAQCRGWLDANVGRAERIAVSSTAEAARLAGEQQITNGGVVAIASAAAARIYGLKIQARNIEDDSTNTTRFMVIGEREREPTGADNTSLLFSTPNKAGALHQALEVLGTNRVNIRRLESRPSKTTVWEYLFFLDIDGHIQDDKLKAALHELQQRVAMMKLLGSYPRASV